MKMITVIMLTYLVTGCSTVAHQTCYAEQNNLISLPVHCGFVPDNDLIIYKQGNKYWTVKQTEMIENDSSLRMGNYHERGI